MKCTVSRVDFHLRSKQGNQSRHLEQALWRRSATYAKRVWEASKHQRDHAHSCPLEPFCAHQGKLGTDDSRAYNPTSLDGWTWPSAQKDGRIGAGQQTTSVGPLKYTKAGTQLPESPMGKYELRLLALYDQDPILQARDGSVWKQALGGR